jgi:hypothetical protein
MDDSSASSARAICYGARQLGASLGVTFVVALMDRRAMLHSSRLIDSLFSRNLSTLGLRSIPAMQGGLLLWWPTAVAGYVG